MPEHSRKFSPQFKAEAVQMVISTGKPIAEVARDLGVHDGTLGNWVAAWRRENPEPDQPLSPVERARVKEPTRCYWRRPNERSTSSAAVRSFDSS